MPSTVPVVKTLAVFAEAKPELDKLRKASTGFEASFLRQLMASMRKTVNEASPLKGSGAETYRGMFDEALADRLAETGSLGIAKQTFDAVSGQLLNAAAFRQSREARPKTDQGIR